MTIDHVEAEIAAMVSGMATPEPDLTAKCTNHAAVAAIPAIKVN
jgi:hypothetical protein